MLNGALHKVTRQVTMKMKRPKREVRRRRGLVAKGFGGVEGGGPENTKNFVNLLFRLRSESRFILQSPFIRTAGMSECGRCSAAAWLLLCSSQEFFARTLLFCHPFLTPSPLKKWRADAVDTSLEYSHNSTPPWCVKHIRNGGCKLLHKVWGSAPLFNFGNIEGVAEGWKSGN